MISQREIISKLSGIKKLFTESFDSDGKLTYSFSGNVETEIISEKEIIFSEYVQWEKENSLLINSKNIYRWTFLSPNKIGLEHLRFGKNNPVFLVEMSPTDGNPMKEWNSYVQEKNIWKSIAPHNCNNDLYSAELDMNNKNPVLCWTVKGPAENYHLKTVYSY